MRGESEIYSSVCLLSNKLYGFKREAMKYYFVLLDFLMFELPEVPCYKELNLHKSLFTLISHDLRVQVVHQTADHSTTITSRL